MSTTTTDSPLTTLRAAVYRLILLALDKPSVERHHLLRSPSFRTSLELLCGHFDLPTPEEDLVPESYVDYESRYLATFEVGFPEAPVVLLASHHSRHEPAPRVVHEHILFYRHFDAAAIAETGEAADHLINELRFLIHLDELCERNPESSESIDRARSDFLDRHPLRWIPIARAQAEDRNIPAFYQVVLYLLDAVLREDRRMINESRLEDTQQC